MDLFENKFDLHCAKCPCFIMALKTCQMVATFFCVKFSPKLQETHIETELPSAGCKRALILYYSIFVCEIRVFGFCERLMSHLYHRHVSPLCGLLKNINFFREHTTFCYFIVW